MVPRTPRHVDPSVRVAELEREVVDLRRNVAELQAHQERYQTLAQISPAGLFQTDANGRCTYANDRCCSIVGLSRNELLGVGWTTHLHPDDRERVVNEWNAAVNNKQAFHSEYRFQRGESALWVVGEAAPELNSDGQLVGFVGFIFDISRRHNAESLLRASEVRLSMALRSARIIAWEWDAETDVLTRSANAPEVFGLEIMTKGFSSGYFMRSINSAHRERVDQALRNAFAGEPHFEFECEVTMPNGGRFWISTQAQIIRNNDGGIKKIFGITRDVTLRKKTLDSLENARRFLAITLDALPSHVAILDDRANIIMVNSAWKKFADQNGFTAANYGVGMNYLQVCRNALGLHAHDAAKVAVALEDLLAQRKLDFYFEYPCHSLTEKRWFVVRFGRFEIDGSTRLFCSHHNVTELKAGAEALRESEARFRQLADSMPQIVWSARADGSLDYQNQRFFETTALTKEEADQPDVWEKILHPDDVAKTAAAWQHSVATGEPFQMEYRYINKPSHGYRWHLGRALPVRNEAGKIVRWFGTCTDIEEQKQIEQALENVRRQLSDHATDLEHAVAERTSQLEHSMKQMESFCYSIAHDLRAPLRAMQGFTTALCEDYAQSFDDTGREYAQRIVTSAQRMERLIQDLLTYGRLSHIEISFEPVSLEKAIEVTLISLKKDIETRKAIIDVQHPLPCIRANAAMIEEILHNLISNALKFVEAGVVPKIVVKTEKTAARVRVFVQDNGIGIEPQYHERIFGVFEKVHGSATEHATGIGLAIVRKSLERLGGEVGVDSLPGKGSCFWFELPSCDESEPV